MIRRLFVLLLALSLCSGANAQALPSRIGAEVLAVIKAKVGARGFAANDPRFGGTLAAASTAVFEIATAVVVAGTAPAWGSVLATAAIAGAVGYGIQALANWIFNPDGTITHTCLPTPAAEHGGPTQSRIYSCSIRGRNADTHVGPTDQPPEISESAPANGRSITDCSEADLCNRPVLADKSLTRPPGRLGEAHRRSTRGD
jgi:hypothetical protein